jgi:hypothetical protein
MVTHGQIDSAEHLETVLTDTLLPKYQQGAKGPDEICEAVLSDFLAVHKTAALSEISGRASKKQNDKSARKAGDVAREKAYKSLEAESLERLRQDTEKQARDAEELADRLRKNAAAARARQGSDGQLEVDFAKQDAELERLRSHLDRVRIELDAQAARAAEANDEPMCRCSVM